MGIRDFIAGMWDDDPVGTILLFPFVIPAYFIIAIPMLIYFCIDWYISARWPNYTRDTHKVK